MLVINDKIKLVTILLLTLLLLGCASKNMLYKNQAYSKEVYEMEEVSDKTFRLYPKEMNFSKKDSILSYYEEQIPLLKNQEIIDFIFEFCQFSDSNPIHQNEAEAVNNLIIEVIYSQNASISEKAELREKVLMTMYDNSNMAEEDSYDYYRMAIRRYLCFIALALQSDEYRYITFLNDARNCILELDRNEECVLQFALLDILEVLIMNNFEYHQGKVNYSIRKLEDGLTNLQKSKHISPEFIVKYNQILKLIRENKISEN